MSATSTPDDLYAMTPQYTERWLSGLNGCYYQHVPEVNLDQIAEDANAKVEVRVLRHVDYDHRRYWRLATVWFDGRPVMVVQNAGREGDDHARRFVTDLAAYMAMVGYLLSISDGDDSDLVDPGQPRDDLLAFYGDRLDVTGEVKPRG